MNEWKILYTLIILLKSGKECNGFNQQHFPIINSHSLSAFFRTTKSVSETACCRECLREKWCSSVTYNRNSRECHLSDVPFVEAGTYLKGELSSDVYIKDGLVRDWLIVFRGIPGIGVNPLGAWLNGTGTTSDPTCRDRRVPSCDTHYRDPLVDNWAALRLKEVKIVFYKGELEKSITFNGTGSKVSNWFDKNRVLASSWPTLVGGKYGHFSIVGDANRRFFISAAYNGGCTGDRIFTVVLTFPVELRCSWDTQTMYPQFLFATGDDMAFPQNKTGMAFADSFAVFIK